MRKHFSIIIAALGLALLAGCDAREQMPVPVSAETGEKVFLASSEAGSKAYIEGLKVLWDAADELAVFDDAGSQKAIFALQSGAGTSAGTFKGLVSSAASHFYAAYPAAGAFAVSENLITLEVPASQKLSEGGRNLDAAALVGVAATEGNELAFKNVVAGIRFSIDMDNVASVSLKGANEEVIAGTVNVDAATGVVDSVADGATEIVFTPAGETFAKGEYILTLLPGRFMRGVALTFTCKDGSTVVRSNESDLTISRSRLLDLGAFISLSENEFSFVPGQTLELSVLSQGVSALAVHSAPEGWTVDASALGSGVLKITAPAAGSTAAPSGLFDLRGTSASGTTVVSDDISVRLYGINSKAEFLEFRTFYQGDDATDNTRLNAPTTDPSVIGKYLVDGALTLNTDLSFDNEDLLLKAYVIKYLMIPLNGNGHTINIDFTGETAVCAFFQYLCSDVSNLNLAGKISYPYAGEGQVAPLATITANADLTIKDVTSSVDISASGKLYTLGGFIAYAYTGNTTLDGCRYNGKMTYSPEAVHARPSFGGLVGRTTAPSLTVKNSVNEGEFTLNLDNRALCTDDASGVGGILGVATAGKTVSFENVENKSTIVVNDLNAIDVRTHYTQTVGANLAEADLSGIAQNGSVVINDFAGYAVTFSKTDVSSVSYGGEVRLDFAIGQPAGVSIVSGSVKQAPEGWTVDFSHITESTPYITVTAPTQDAVKAGTAAGIGEIAVEINLSSGAVASNVDKPVVRLYGINNKAEFLAFRNVYEPVAADGSGQNSPTITGLDQWLVNGEIALNADISFATEDLHRFYIVKFLDLPIEGNNRTITFDLTSDQAMLSFCQGLHADVKNLYFDGTMTATGKSPEVCMLAARGINTNSSSRKTKEVTLTNVHIKSTAVISFEYDGAGSGAYVAGFVSKGTEANSTLTYRNCTVEGTIQSIKGAPQGLAGFSGADGTGTGIWSKFYDCAFTGTIKLVQGLNKSGSIRIGGIVGDNCRNSYYENCVSSGTITADMGGFVFNTSSKGSGIGGLLGYTQNTAEGSSSEFKNCTFSGSISAVNMLASTAEFGWTDAENYDSSTTFGQIVGNKSRKIPTGLDTCTESGSLTYSFAE